MNSKTKLALGALTALAMLLLTFAVPRGGALQERSWRCSRLPLGCGRFLSCSS